MIRAACPGRDDKDYHIILSDHAVGTGCSNELFERVSFGLYRLARISVTDESTPQATDGQKAGDEAGPAGETPLQLNDGVALE
jgi:hypothetical protein